MFSDTKFWRLVWKEYRTQRALWLVLAILPPLLQSGSLVLELFLNSRAYGTFFNDIQINALMAIGFIGSVTYILGCCATMFSVEH